MPVALKRSQLKYKNPETGTYVGVDAVAEKTTAEMISEVESAGHAKLTEINARATEVQASLPKVGEMEDIVAVPFVQSESYPEGAYVIQTVSGVNYLYKLPDGHTAGVAWGEFTVDGPLTFSEELNETVRELVAVQDEQPESPENKIWLTETPPEPIVIPTFDDYDDFKKDIRNEITDIKDSKTSNVDLDISDNSGNVIVRFEGGHIKTKEFNSSTVESTITGKQDKLTFDTTPTENSTNPVTSGGIKTALDTKQDVLEFDLEPTLNSTNPVTSNGIKTALNEKQDIITVDNEPTENSDNLVKSGGVYSALKNIDIDLIQNSTAVGVDLDISDNSGNVIVRFKDGHVKTKEFDSSTLAASLSEITAGKQDKLTFDSEPIEGSDNPVKSGGVYSVMQNIAVDIIKDSDGADADFDISDNYGNVIARFVNGGLRTKQFDGRKYTTFSASGDYYTGHELVVTINHPLSKDSRIVLHIETGSAPWTSGGRVAYYADDIQITESTWRGAEAYLEYKLPKNVNTISAVLPTNAFYEDTQFSFEVSLLGDIPITPTIVTIKKDGTGDYTSLRSCLRDIGYKANDVLNPYRIEIYPGTYDVLDDYTQAELENIFYGPTSINQYSQTSFVGPKLLNGMSLVGMGRPYDVILTAWLDPSPTDDLSKRQRGQISTLNLQGSGSIENLTIVAQNMRYCVHDDFSAPLGKKCTRIVKNCVFRGYNIAYGPHTTYGAGMPQSGMDFTFIGCDFGEDAGVHTQDLLYHRPEIHLIDCKGHSFRIGDNETVDPITEYTVYRFDNCNFLDIRHSMVGNTPHVKICGTGSSSPFYQLHSLVEYNTGEVTIVPPDVLGTLLSVGTCVEMYNDNASGPRFRAITSLDNFAGVVVFVDENNNTYIQTKGYIRTDRLGLNSFALNDYIGLSGTSCAVVASASDAFGKIIYVDNSGEGYVRIGGRF